MDILHLSPKEILDLEGFEYLEALNYSWVVFNLRKMAYSDKKNKKLIDNFKIRKFAIPRVKNQIIEFDHKYMLT